MNRETAKRRCTSGNGGNGGAEDEHPPEDIMAAETLAGMKARRLSPDTAESLLNIVLSHPLPALPPCPRIHPYIERCSRPFRKQLTNSDVNDDQSRLALEKKFTVTELHPLLKEGEDLTVGVPVTVHVIGGSKYDMVFKIWCGKLCVLTSGWKIFRHAFRLCAHQDILSLWMFRHVDGTLCFFITPERHSWILRPLKKVKRNI